MNIMVVVIKELCVGNIVSLIVSKIVINGVRSYLHKMLN